MCLSQYYSEHGNAYTTKQHNHERSFLRTKMHLFLLTVCVLRSNPGLHAYQTGQVAGASPLSQPMAFALIFVCFLFCFFTPDILVGKSFVEFRYGDQIFPKYLLVSIKCYRFFFSLFHSLL